MKTEKLGRALANHHHWLAWEGGDTEVEPYNCFFFICLDSISVMSQDLSRQQQQCSRGWVFPSTSATSVCVPTGIAATPLPLPETLQDQQVGLAQAPIKLLLLTWVPVRIRFCVHPFKSEVSFALSPMGLLKLSRSGLQSHMLWGFIFPVQDPWTGEFDMGLRTLTPMGNPLQYNCSPVCGLPTQGYGIWLYHESAPPTHLVLVPSLCL